MATVFDIVSQAGSLPIDELKLRANTSDVDTRISELEKLGLVEVKQETIPEFPDVVDVVALTTKGFKQAIR